MRKLLPFLLLLIGAAAAVVVVFHQQIFQQNASVVTLSTLAIKGTVYIDTNNNGKFDSTEKGYSGTPKPLVRMALFTEVCQPTPTPKASGTPVVTSPTPTPHITGTPTPTLAPGCRSVCPMVACRRDGKGNVTCPACSVVCLTPTANNNGGNSLGTGEQGSGKATVGSVVSSQEKQDAQDVAQTDACKTIPEKVVPCTVNDDGTYTCIAQNVSVSRFSIILNPPVGYEDTSKNNPFSMTAEEYQKNQPQSVDFGILQQAMVTPPPGCYYQTCEIACPIGNPNCCPRKLVCPSTSVTPTPMCIPQPDCLAKHTCNIPTPSQGWCSPTGQPLTNNDLTKLMIYLNTLLRQKFGR